MYRTVLGQTRVSRHAVTVTKISATIVLISSCAMILFGIGVPPIWQGLVGVLVSLEGFYGAAMLDITRVRIFMFGLFATSIVSLVLGVLALNGNSFVDCGFDLTDELIASGLFGPVQFGNLTSSADFENCVSAVKLYAQVQLFSGIAVAVLLIIFVFPAYKEIQRGLKAAKTDRQNLEVFHYS